FARHTTPSETAVNGSHNCTTVFRFITETSCFLGPLSVYVEILPPRRRIPHVQCSSLWAPGHADDSKRHSTKRRRRQGEKAGCYRYDVAADVGRQGMIDRSTQYPRRSKQRLRLKP